MTLAGYMASDGFWAGFQKKWERMLRERYPIAPFVHMSQLVAGVDPFERVAGWTEERVNALVLDAVHLLQELDKDKFCAFACTVDVTARDKLVSEGTVIGAPVEICAEVCVGSAFFWYLEKHSESVELAYIFFDQGERFMNGIRQKWLEKHKPLNRISLEPFWGLVVNVQPVDMRDTPPIQAADLVAWAITRGRSEKIRRYKHLADIIVGNREFSGIIPSTRLILDEAALRKKHPPPA